MFSTKFPLRDRAGVSNTLFPIQEVAGLNRGWAAFYHHQVIPQVSLTTLQRGDTTFKKARQCTSTVTTRNVRVPLFTVKQ